MVNKILMFLMLGMFLISLTSAIDNQGIGIQGETFTFTQICNDATYITISTIQYPNRAVEVINTNMTSTGSGAFQYNFTDLVVGRYDVTGISDGCTQTFATYFDITPTGFSPNIARGIMGIGLLLILIIFFIFSLVGLFVIEDYKGKFALYWVCHILIVGITFIAWHMAIENLRNGNAIAGIFKVFFYVSTISVFPMVILSLAWIIYIHTFNEHFQRLIDKGEDTETAFRMASKKRNWWFHGK